MYCSNIGSVTISYKYPDKEAQDSYPSYRSTDFKVSIESIFVLGSNRINEYMVDNLEVIAQLEERASLILEMKLYWKDI